MKYKIKKKANTSARVQDYQKPLFAKRIYKGKSDEPIDFVSLFEFSDEFTPPLPVPLKKRSRLSRLFSRIKAFFKRLFNSFKKRAKARREASRKRPETLYMMCGALCGSVLVSLVCVSVVLFSLFHRYGAPYTTVTVPDLVGTEFDGELDGEDSLFSYVVDYEYNPNVKAGKVISQSPPAGTARRVYRSSGHCLISLKVSCAKEAYTLPSLIGLSERDAALELKNHGMIPVIEREYSADIKSGTILRCSHDIGSILRDGDKVTLTVSLGPQVIYCSVPDVRGLTEMQAISRLRSAGLALGKVTYVSSDRASGTVIAQGQEPKAALREGTPIDITVSTGILELRTVPELYGMTLVEASNALRACGLIIGTVIPVQSAEAKGTVIAQTPLPTTPITSSTVTVDVYISS